MHPSSPSTAADYFGARVEAYDSLIRRAVPRYEEATSRLADSLPSTAGRVLELGCGTGNLSLVLARRYPEAHLVCVDAAPEMVDLTRRRVAAALPGRPGGAEFRVARFEELAPEERPCDLIASSFSLHHVRDKAALFRSLRERLRAGGRLCFADQMRGEPEEVHARFWAEWLAFCREPGHCTEEEIRSLLEHSAAHDHYATLGEHFRLLRAASFGEIDCVWRCGMWGVLTATAV